MKTKAPMPRKRAPPRATAIAGLETCSRPPEMADATTHAQPASAIRSSTVSSCAFAALARNAISSGTTSANSTADWPFWFLSRDVIA